MKHVLPVNDRSWGVGSSHLQLAVFCVRHHPCCGLNLRECLWFWCDHWTAPPNPHCTYVSWGPVSVVRRPPTAVRLTSSFRPSFLPPPTSPNPKLRQMDPLEMDADMHSLGSTTWLLDQRDSNRRPVSTKYETTIFWGRNPNSHSSAPHPRTCPSTPVHIQFLKWPLTHAHTVHASPVPSHCDGKASLRTANSCTPSSDLPGDPHQPLYPPWLTVQQLSRASSNTLGQPLSPFCRCSRWSSGTDDPGLTSFYSGPALSTNMPLPSHPLPDNLHLPPNPRSIPEVASLLYFSSNFRIFSSIFSLPQTKQACSFLFVVLYSSIGWWDSNFVFQSYNFV